MIMGGSLAPHTPNTAPPIYLKTKDEVFLFSDFGGSGSNISIKNVTMKTSIRLLNSNLYLYSQHIT